MSPSNVILFDELNNETAQRRCPKGENMRKKLSEMYNEDITVLTGKLYRIRSLKQNYVHKLTLQKG